MFMKLDSITAEEVDAVSLRDSPAYVNQVLRTLRRILGKAVKWNVIASAPRLRLQKETGRTQLLDPDFECKLMAYARQPLRDVLMIMLDTGMRPEEVFRMRIENVDFGRKNDLYSRRQNPGCKTSRSD